ncbi:cation:dicarboxylate symporter family transporter [Lysinibacillus sp. NPDC097231]|uniref:cation:dicarboxylate symporter family transporter n=1 Tax=Lysinibacillus sp. NPDC097231 TaxID=3364142 RepID=UPI0037F73C27
MGFFVLLIPIIAAVSPIVDMGNTVVNVTGDLVGTQIVYQRNQEYANEETMPYMRS